MTNETSSGLMPSHREEKPLASQPLPWLVLAAIVVVCAVFFPATPTRTRSIGPGNGSVAERPRILGPGGNPRTPWATELHSTEMGRADAVQNAAILQALGKTIDLDFEKKGIKDVLTDLSRQLGIPIWPNRVTFRDDIDEIYKPVTIHLRGISGRSALALVLEPGQLAWVVEDGVLKVSTVAAIEDILEANVYDVTDLVGADDSTKSDVCNINSLINLLLATIAPDSWENLGGPGVITPIAFDKTRVMCVRQTSAIHDEVALLLASLRKARRAPQAGHSRPIIVSADDSLAARRATEIRTALNRPVSIDARDRPLEEVVREIARQAEIPLFFEKINSFNEWVAFDQPSTLAVAAAPAHSALKLILEPALLTWVIRHEVLIVTTTRDALDHEYWQVYDISDWFSPRPNEGKAAEFNKQQFRSVIMKMTDPDAWKGGMVPAGSQPIRGLDGQVPEFHAEGIDVLVIRQTQDVHQQIAEFLQKLRDLRRL